MNTTDEVMTRYILGQLDDRESQALEESFFCDDAVFDALMVAEGELIEAYLHGELPEEQQALFESQLKSSPKRRSRVEMARLLVAEAQRDQEFPPGSTGGGPANESGPALGSGVAGANLPVGKPGRRTLYRALPAAACLVMAVVTGWSWQEASTANQAKAETEGELSAQEKTQAVLEQQLAEAAAVQRVNVFTPFITRGANASKNAPVVRVVSDRDLVLLQVQWSDFQPEATYRLELTHSGTHQQWIHTGLSADQDEGAAAPFLFGVYAAELPEGDYQLAIFDEGLPPSEEALKTFAVVVEKPTPQP